jgi:aspartate 1-decarboxylase
MIRRTLLRAKIHRAVITNADLHYVGSLTIDEALMDAAGLHEFELVHIADVDNGSRLETYVIRGERGSGIIGANGAAARLLELGDRVIIMAYAQVEEPLPEDWSPRIVLVDQQNQIIEVR